MLHKMHGHPQILALTQGALYPELKFYMRGDFPIAEIQASQLRPRTQDFADLSWLVVNKPQIAYLTHQFLFHRTEMRLIYCLRNPIALFHSRFASMSEVGREIYGRTPSWQAVADSVEREYRISLTSFAQAYDPGQDCTISLESFAAQLDDNLELIWQTLDVPILKDAELQVLEFCETCGHKLEVKRGNVGSRNEELLHCPSCDRFYIGPGGYNYIRKVAAERLAGWKTKDHADELASRFERLLGSGLMAFFIKESYLEKGSQHHFTGLFNGLMASLKI